MGSTTGVYGSSESYEDMINWEHAGPMTGLPLGPLDYPNHTESIMDSSMNQDKTARLPIASQNFVNHDEPMSGSDSDYILALSRLDGMGEPLSLSHSSPSNSPYGSSPYNSESGSPPSSPAHSPRPDPQQYYLLPSEGKDIDFQDFPMADLQYADPQYYGGAHSYGQEAYNTRNFDQQELYQVQISDPMDVTAHHMSSSFAGAVTKQSGAGSKKRGCRKSELKDADKVAEVRKMGGCIRCRIGKYSVSTVASSLFVLGRTSAVVRVC